MRAACLSAFVLLLGTAARAQDQSKIDQAIRKGVEYLKTAGSPGHEHSGATHSDELILWTFIHADVPPSNPKFKQMLDRILADEPQQTYKVALQAMCLEELDRVKYQNRIAHCAQHLVDNQCTNGQWTYGKPTAPPKDLPPAAVASGGEEKPRTGGVREFGGPEKKSKPKITRKIQIIKQRDGGGEGDNSNSQYAALGLRACFDSGIMIPEATITGALKWWAESVHAEDGGAGKGSVASGDGGKSQGWSYKGAADGEAYGSMTAGAVGSLTIYDYMLKKDFKRNPLTKNGLAWLGGHYSVTENPGRGGDWYLYYLYGLERAGILYDTPKIGGKDWYADGAKVLLASQGADGSWGGEWNTCFAILFLKKATRPLVATDGGKR